MAITAREELLVKKFAQAQELKWKLEKENVTFAAQRKALYDQAEQLERDRVANETAIRAQIEAAEKSE
jgi:hypothetical protein